MKLNFFYILLFNCLIVSWKVIFNYAYPLLATDINSINLCIQFHQILSLSLSFIYKSSFACEFLGLAYLIFSRSVYLSCILSTNKNKKTMNQLSLLFFSQAWKIACIFWDRGNIILIQCLCFSQLNKWMKIFIFYSLFNNTHY